MYYIVTILLSLYGECLKLKNQRRTWLCCRTIVTQSARPFKERERERAFELAKCFPNGEWGLKSKCWQIEFCSVRKGYNGSQRVQRVSLLRRIGPCKVLKRAELAQRRIALLKEESLTWNLVQIGILKWCLLFQAAWVTCGCLTKWLGEYYSLNNKLNISLQIKRIG